MKSYKVFEIPHQAEECLLIPSALLNSNRYRGIGSEVIILYAHLLDKSGLVEQTGPEAITLHLSDVSVDELCHATVITKHKTVQALKKLVDAGLVILDQSIPA